MAKKKPANELSNVEQIPDYLIQASQDVGTGLEEAHEFIQPARLKIVQNQTGGEVGEKFQPGDVILMPQMMRLGEMNYDGAKHTDSLITTFTFTPLLFFAEWLSINKWGSGLPFIRERTNNKKSLLAQKAKNFDTRKEIIDGDEVRNVEVLNFMIKLDHEEFSDIPAVISFSKGEWRKGSNFLTLMKTRHVAMYHQRFTVNVSERSNDDGKWFGFDVSPDTEQPWVAPEHAEAFAEKHRELKEIQNASKIVVDHDEEDGQATHESDEF